MHQVQYRCLYRGHWYDDDVLSGGLLPWEYAVARCQELSASTGRYCRVVYARP